MQINGYQSGNLLLKLITERAKLVIPTSIQMLRNNITNVSDKMVKFGEDIEKFNAYLNGQISVLTAYGHEYEKYKNVKYHLLQAYDKCTEPAFHAYLTTIKDKHETGGRTCTYEEIMKLALNKFNLMVKKGEWNPKKGSSN
jgi:hypothetical protein